MASVVSTVAEEVVDELCEPGCTCTSETYTEMGNSSIIRGRLCDGSGWTTQIGVTNNQTACFRDDCSGSSECEAACKPCVCAIQKWSDMSRMWFPLGAFSCESCGEGPES